MLNTNNNETTTKQRRGSTSSLCEAGVDPRERASVHTGRPGPTGINVRAWKNRSPGKTGGEAPRPRQVHSARLEEVDPREGERERYGRPRERTEPTNLRVLGF